MTAVLTGRDLLLNPNISDFNDDFTKPLDLFADAIAEDEALEILGTQKNDQGDECFVVFVKGDKEKRENDYKVTVPIQEVMEKVECLPNARHIISVVKGDTEAQSLHGISRIVGYFSRTENWNKGKLGELKDRQKGDYKLG